MPNYLHYISLEIQQIKQERLLKDKNNGNVVQGLTLGERGIYPEDMQIITGVLRKALPIKKIVCLTSRKILSPK